jgi:hypothetical protein
VLCFITEPSPKRREKGRVAAFEVCRRGGEKGRVVACVKEEGEGKRVPLLERREMGRKWILTSS